MSLSSALFPIHVKYSVIQNHIVILGDPLEISEYFYIFRKKWNDAKFRILSNQYTSHEEHLELIENYKISKG